MTALARLAVSVAIIPLGLIGMRIGRNAPRVWRLLLALALLAIAVFLALHQARALAAKVAHPPPWDFLALWLYGKAAVAHLNIYQPGFASQLAAPFHPDAVFRREVIDVGFVYPPMSIFLFLPLGLLGYQSAAALWAGINVAVFIADVILLWLLFSDGDRRDPLALLAACVILLKLPGTSQTIDFMQSNLIALLAALLFIADRDRARGGLWLALGFMVKPLLGILFVYGALRKKWAATIAGVVTLAVVTIGSWAVLGTQTMLSYVSASPYARQPLWVFTEKTNQSLLATILRATGWAGEYPPTSNTLYLWLTVALIAISVILILRVPRDEWGVSIALLLGLLIYPGTQFFYSDLLIIPALMLWKVARPSIDVSAAALVFITAEFIAMAQTPYAVFVATAANWLLFAIVAFAWRRPPPERPQPAFLLPD